MKRIFAAGIAMSVAMAVSAGSSAFAADKPQIAFVVNIAADFWKAAEAGMAKAQAELPDYNLVFRYPDQSTVAIQNAIVNDLIAAGTKAVMISAIDPNATDVLNGFAKQTAFFTTDSDASKSDRIAYKMQGK